MKSSVIIFLVVSSVVLTHGDVEAEKKIIKEAHKACQADPATHIDEEIVHKIRKSEDVDKSVVGAYSVCMFKKIGIMDEHGKVNKDVVKKALAHFISDEAKLKETVEKCSVEKEDTVDTAMAIGKCFKEHAPEYDHEHV